MKIGVIYCGYNQLDNVKETLSFWNNIKIDGIEIVVCTISVPFLEYKDIPIEEDGTIEWIKALEKNNIKESIFEPVYIQEPLVRTIALRSILKEKDVDIIWQVDSDEFYTVNDVKNILQYLNENYSLGYSINFKNYIFDSSHYLDKFCIPRINRFPYKLYGFISDNHVAYVSDNGSIMACNGDFLKEIPKNIAWVKHITWTHKNGENKVKYQLKHFGDCSYRWNSEKKELELNYDYYIRNGYEIPIILKDEN